MTTGLLPLWLALALGQPDAEAPPTEPEADASAELGAALELLSSEEPAQLAGVVEGLLAEIAKDPELIARDGDIRKTAVEARVALVWLALAMGEPDKANDAMDEAIRSAGGRALPTSFGPPVRRIQEDRLPVLEQAGSATIEVDCSVPCQVLVDEQRSANPTDPLYLGDYRVWVGARDGSIDWKYYDVSLDTPDATVKLVYAEDTPAELPPPATTGDVEPSDNSDTEDKPKARKRMLPRWAEVLGVTAGVGLLVTGSVLMAIHDKCKNDLEADPGDSEACPELWENTPQAYVLVGSGAGLLALSGIFLTVDEVRVGRAKATQAMVTWTFQF